MAELIGFIGLGNMGRAMAANVLTAGYRLHVYNRTPEKAKPLITQGARLMSHPSDTGEPGGIVVTMLADDQAVENIVYGERGILKRLGPGGIHMSMSTVSPMIARRLAEDHERDGVSYLAAPVFGRPEAAAARKLWICLSGPQAAKDRVTPILNVLGQGIFDFGEKPEAANVVKLAGNFLLASAIEALAEALTLAEKNGVDRTTLAAMLGRTLFACPAYQTYGEAIAQERYLPAGFTVSLGLKDVNLVLQTAAGSSMPMPLASLLHDRLLSVVAQGNSDLDWVAIALDVAREGGLRRRSLED
ncbi:MAG TPA: NAD(P)-dependent oxidoreductase [Nitrospira sp.]|nr:NAD(P)-dependent oxidoreductase [Nitrospira sp.]